MLPAPLSGAPALGERQRGVKPTASGRRRTPVRPFPGCFGAGRSSADTRCRKLWVMTSLGEGRGGEFTAEMPMVVDKAEMRPPLAGP